MENEQKKPTFEYENGMLFSDKDFENLLLKCKDVRIETELCDFFDTGGIIHRKIDYRISDIDQWRCMYMAQVPDKSNLWIILHVSEWTASEHSSAITASFCLPVVTMSKETGGTM